MKTIPLEEALKRQPAAKIEPFASDIGAKQVIARLGIGMASVATMHQSDHGDPLERAALLAHFYNHGPELVGALHALTKEAEAFAKVIPAYSASEALKSAREVLAKASTIQLP